MKTITSKKHYYMPSELIEQIMLNLPVKSLIRFSTASKSWNSIIFEPKFAQSYRGREMIVFSSLYAPLACALSSVSSDNATDGATSFDSPFDSPQLSFRASCGYLWCVEFKDSLHLYNPSIQTYRKLPNSEFEADWIKQYPGPIFAYGLGYDSVCDDYKILKIILKNRYVFVETKSEMYSLRSDCWRKVESQPPQFSKFLSKEGLFVSGAFHWLVTPFVDPVENGEYIEEQCILSFDMSEVKFGLIELPEHYFVFEDLNMIDFGGKLRVYVKKYDYCHFSVWVMEDYDSKLWTKEMEIDYDHMPPTLDSTLLRPFYFYDGAGNLVRAVTNCIDEKMFIYKEENGSSSSAPSLVEKNFGINGFNVMDSLTYIESIVCPLTWHGSSS